MSGSVYKLSSFLLMEKQVTCHDIWHSSTLSKKQLRKIVSERNKRTPRLSISKEDGDLSTSGEAQPVPGLDSKSEGWSNDVTPGETLPLNISQTIKVWEGRYLHACKTSSNTLNPPLASPHATLPTNQASADILPSPNIKQYSKSVFLYNDPSIPGSFRSSRPLLLLLPWLGAKAHSYKKYVQLYFKLGFDVLVAESSLSHFLWPKRGLVYAGDLLELLVREKDLSSRTLFVHAISIGGYIFAQMLVRSSNGHEAQREMLAGIHGQVFDSLVVGSLEKMATGVARMISYPLLQTVVVRGTLLYFSLLKAQTADYYEKGIQTFWESPIRCPALFFYSMDDPLSDHIMVEQLLMDWEKQGIRVQGKRWDSSIHAGHLQRHPQEYTETLNSFICSLKSDSPKCKL